ncbi:MAG TPA: hypothetical protein VI160_01385 [Gemmatimonadales bacterium]
MPRRVRHWLAAAGVLGAALTACYDNGGPRTLPYLLLSPLVDSVFAGASVNAPAVTYFDAHGDSQPAGTVRWSSSAPGIATVDSVTGAIHGVAGGIAVISAAARGTQGSALVVVSRPLDIALLLDTIILLKNDTFAVPVQVLKQGGGAPAPKFHVATNAVFTIDSVTGAVAGVGSGGPLPFTVTATDGVDTVSATGAVEVLNPGDTTGGKAAFTILGSVLERRRATARAENYTRHGDTLTFRLAVKVPLGASTVETVDLTLRDSVAAPGVAAIDSLSFAEEQSIAFVCAPARSYALWSSRAVAPNLLALSRPGGTLTVRKIIPVTGGQAISGSFSFDAQRVDDYADPSGRLPIRGIFVAPLIRNTATCH